MSMLTNEPFVFRSGFFTSRIKEAEQAAAKVARIEGAASALLRLLATRGFVVTDSLRDRIMTCGDAARIEDALDRAVTSDPGQPFAF